MSGAASGLSNAANVGYGAANTAAGLPGQTFGQYAGGMAQLPMDKATTGEQINVNQAYY
jgi:hypothetical protein